jgi:hypothetical protein
MSTVDILLEMGFSKAKAEKAYAVVGDKGIEAAMEWLLAHADELDVAESSTEPQKAQSTVEPGGQTANPQEASGQKDEVTSEQGGDQSPELAKSIKCEDCGKLFKSNLEVEYHAAKSNHQNFSESTEEIKPLTEEEKKERLRQLEEKMKERRAQKEAEERREQIEKEKVRRRTGQEISEAKKRLQDEDLKRMAEERKREKMEEKMARQRVLDQIARDKAARQEKFGNAPKQEVAPPPVAPVVTKAPAAPAKDYTETKIQIRLPNGQSLTQTFSAKEQLAAVRLYVEMNRTDGAAPFSLMTSFPKKIFGENDMETPLDQLGLVPSAVIIVTKGT